MDATTLRWTIAVIGVIGLALLYLFGNPKKKRKPKASRRKAGAERREPTLDQPHEEDPGAEGLELTGQGELPIGDEAPTLVSVPKPKPKPRKPAGPPPDKIITLFIQARDNHVIAGDELLQAALKTGMSLGEMNIFHRHADGSEQAVFSLANAVKPGVFDKDAWNTFETRALAMFLTLPGPLLALDAWDMQLATARRIAELLQSELHDENHELFTRQKEAQVREEMRQYDRGRARQTFV